MHWISLLVACLVGRVSVRRVQSSSQKLVQLLRSGFIPSVPACRLAMGKSTAGISRTRFRSSVCREGGSRILQSKDYFSITEPLSDLSSVKKITLKPITTVTFFSGSSPETVEDILKERVRDIVKANPWLVGRVTINSFFQNLQIAYPPVGAELPDDIWAELFQRDPPDLTFDSRTPYEVLATKILSSSATLPVLGLPAALFSDSEELVTRITLVSDPSDASAFALVLSMSHVIADGFNYYQILNMLSPQNNITSLTVKRSMEATKKIVEACGAAEHDFMWGELNPSLGITIAKELASGRKAKAYCHYVDDNMMAAAKKAAKERCKEQSVDYVSSNDILVSMLGKITKPRLMSMIVNLRGKVQEFDSDLVGNYNCRLLMDEDVYSNPAKIRKILNSGPPLIAHTQPLPNELELQTAKLGCLGYCTSFASFSDGQDLVLGSATQQLHLPLFSVDGEGIERAFFFRPRAGKLAVMIMSRHFEREDFLKSMPFGADVFE